jgi:hypothetical protein
MTNLIVSLLCLALTLSSFLGLLILLLGLRRVFREAPQLNPLVAIDDEAVIDGNGVSDEISLTVVIPSVQ